VKSWLNAEPDCLSLTEQFVPRVIVSHSVAFYFENRFVTSIFAKDYSVRLDMRGSL